ncbi:uncharacterized protein LOC133914150 [Phragmites australis]|uniref:uncharacterized protein LOC133914150 n=1 Tax=Phragmites australis TaxID=29695 RepID=UPI002D78CDD1|nr:uncharacterized protein LOC133914150 [Phragmites australis]
MLPRESTSHRRACVGSPRRRLRPRRGHWRRRAAQGPVGPHRGTRFILKPMNAMVFEPYAEASLLTRAGGGRGGAAEDFGCFFCWELASVPKDSMVKFDSAGVKLIAIGVGTPDKARIHADGVKLVPAFCRIMFGDDLNF